MKGFIDKFIEENDFIMKVYIILLLMVSVYALSYISEII